jgi:hypothetical protein
MVGNDKVSSVHTPEDNEQLVDYSSSPERMNIEINMIYLFAECFIAYGGGFGSS